MKRGKKQKLEFANKSEMPMATSVRPNQVGTAGT